MSRRRRPSSAASRDPALTALATAVREAYPHGVEAVVAVVETAFAALEARVSARFTALEQEVATLRRRVAADSTTSSQPPSTDVSRAVRPVSLRERSERRRGGQRGHPGTTLAWRAAPDDVQPHRPTTCAACGHALAAEAPAMCVERAQVVDLPPVTLVTTEHRRVAVTCAHCGHTTAGTFPPGVLVGVQYGPEVKALAVALHSYHLLPYARTAELLDALLGDGPSPGSLVRWTATAARTLAPAQRAAARRIGQSATAHADETTLHVARRRLWLHVAATATHTHYHVHPQRGRAGILPGGVWDAFSGTLVHDGWWANFHLGTPEARHQLCLAHLRREAKGLYALTEELHRPERWLLDVAQLLGRLHRLVRRAAAAGRPALAPRTRRRIAARYDALLRTARGRHPYPVQGRDNTRPGRPQRGKVAAFADRLLKYRADVLRCAADATIPPDNNQAERDLRMAKLVDKISGGFRTLPAAHAFATLRSALSTAQKQGWTAIAVLRDVFASHPTPAPLTGG
jgi:transposase